MSSTGAQQEHNHVMIQSCNQGIHVVMQTCHHTIKQSCEPPVLQLLSPPAKQALKRQNHESSRLVSCLQQRLVQHANDDGNAGVLT